MCSVVVSLVAQVVRLGRPWLFGSPAALTAVIVYQIYASLQPEPQHGPVWLVPVLWVTVVCAAIAALPVFGSVRAGRDRARPVVA